MSNSSATPATVAPPQRLLSLDALRGLDMCMILGLGSVLEHFSRGLIPGTALARWIDVQFEHVDWEGFHLEDGIFPLFLFIAGLSMTLALPKRIEREGKAKAAWHLVARALTIFVIGVIYSGGIGTGESHDHWPMDGLNNVRWLGVLQRIGTASAAAGLLFLFLKTRGLIVAAVSLLVGYYLMLKYIPVPGFGAGDFAEGHNFADYIDKQWLPGRPYLGLDHDPEGILSTLPAIATALFGVLAGIGLQSPASTGKKVAEFIIIGVALISLGWVLDPYFPIIKKIWSSTFVLVAGGWSCIALGVFFGLVEGLQLRFWTTPFVWVGANPIFLYLVHGLGGFQTITDSIVGHPPHGWVWISSLCQFLLMLLTARLLYKRRVFIRI